MTGEIDVEVRNVYGVTTHYPACYQAEIFARLAGTKTLTAHALRDIKALGFQVHYCMNVDNRLIVIKSEAA